MSKKQFRNPVLFKELSKACRYQVSQAALLCLVPLICGVILLMLLSVFAQLNLYYIEANGLMLDEQVRDGYFKQVEIEMVSVFGYLALQLGVTAVVSWLVMRWATAPFSAAKKMVETAMQRPQDLKPNSRWLSESPGFSRVIWQFASRIKGGGENTVKQALPFGTNYPFFAKFLVTFAILSVSTGYVLSIVMDSVYFRIIDLALHLVKTNSRMNHYFLAQQDILSDAYTMTTVLAMVLYVVLGLQISRYMSTMLAVFSRAVHEDKFPLVLRSTDIYQDVAETMNEGRARIK